MANGKGSGYKIQMLRYRESVARQVASSSTGTRQLRVPTDLI